MRRVLTDSDIEAEIEVGASRGLTPRPGWRSAAATIWRWLLAAAFAWLGVMALQRAIAGGPEGSHAHRLEFGALGFGVALGLIGRGKAAQRIAIAAGWALVFGIPVGLRYAVLNQIPLRLEPATTLAGLTDDQIFFSVFLAMSALPLLAFPFLSWAPAQSISMTALRPPLTSRLFSATPVVACAWLLALAALGSALNTTYHLEPVARLGGYVGAMTIAGDRAYVDVGSTLAVYDVHDASRPALLGRTAAPLTNQPGRRPSAIASDGRTAYVLGSGGAFGGDVPLWAFDVADPGNPRGLGGVSGRESVAAIAVADGLLYKAGPGPFGSGYLSVLGTEEPQQPILRGTVTFDDPAYLVAVEGSNAYVATRFDCDPCPPGAAPRGQIAIVDISDPTSLTLRSSLTIPVGILRMAASGDFLFATHQGGLLITIDVADPSRPVQRSALALPESLAGGWFGDFGGLAVGDGIVSVGGDRGRKLMIVDVHDVDTMHLAATIESPASHVAARGRTVFCSPSSSSGTQTDIGTLEAWDVSAPERPQRLGAILSFGVRRVVPTSDGVLLVATDDTLRRIDWRDARQPVAEHGVVMDDVMDAAGDGHDAFVLRRDGRIGLASERPDAFQDLGGADATVLKSLMALSDGLLFATDGEATLQIIDVTSPKQPRWLASATVVSRIEAVARAGDRVFVAHQGGTGNGPSESVAVFNIRDPKNPQRIAGIQSWRGRTDPPVSVTVWDNLVAFGVSGDDVRLFTTSDRLGRREVRVPYDAHMRGWRVAASGDLLFVAGNELRAFRRTWPSDVSLASDTVQYLLGGPAAAAGDVVYLPEGQWGVLAVRAYRRLPLILAGDAATAPPLVTRSDSEVGR